jgi:hypothetical protein
MQDELGEEYWGYLTLAHVLKSWQIKCVYI